MSDLSEDDLKELQNQAGRGTPRGEKMASLLAEVRRHRAAVTADGEFVRMVVREAVAKVAETRWWREGKRPYAEPEIVDAAADRIAERLALPTIARVTEMRLCEASRVVLHPDQLYRFTVAPGCQLCEAEAGITPHPNELDAADPPGHEELEPITVGASSLSHGFYDALAGRASSCDNEEYRRGYVIGQASPGEPVKYTVIAPELSSPATTANTALIVQLRHACAVAFGDLLAQGMPRGTSTGRLLEAAIVAAAVCLAQAKTEETAS